MKRLCTTLVAAGVALALMPALPTASSELRAQISAPSTHRAPLFLETHGASMRKGAAACQACHQQESCLVCHRGTPSVAEGFPPAASNKAIGVTVVRHRPASHTADWVKNHRSEASAHPQTCAACHVRQDCLSCHRPDVAQPGGYHPPGFLAGHPAQAYTREASCADCHNTGQFCTTCHQRAGLTANGPLAGGYHDAKRAFLGGHGQAARQSLESCVSCHAETDCLACHTRFNPHGPGFDADRLRGKNIQMCQTCHGAVVPGGQ